MKTDNCLYQLNPLAIFHAPLSRSRVRILRYVCDQKRMVEPATMMINLKIAEGHKDVAVADIDYLESKGYLAYYYPNGEFTGTADRSRIRITAAGCDALEAIWIRHEAVLLGSILGIAGTLLGVLLGYLIKK